MPNTDEEIMQQVESELQNGAPDTENTEEQQTPDEATGAGDAGQAQGEGSPEELPELEGGPGEEEEPPHEAPHEGPAPDALPESVLRLMGVQDQSAALERIAENEVRILTDQGVPEVVARELVSLRQQSGGYRPRDEPAARARTGNQSAPRIERMARQIEYVNGRTGVDMMQILRDDPELMRGIADYSEGRGGFDVMGAYQRYRMGRRGARSRVPATESAGGGTAGGGRADIANMTDAEIMDIDRRIKNGERVYLP